MLKIFKIKYLFWLIILEIIIFAHHNNLFSFDEGLTLGIAWDLINNKVLYYDIFEFVAPGVFYLIYFVWKLFGVSFASANIISIIAIFLSAIGIFKISCAIKKNKLCYLPPFLLVILSATWPIISYYTFNLLFIIWGAYFFIKFLDNHDNKNLIISGLFTFLSILFLQHKGLTFLLAIIFWLVILKFKDKKNALFKKLLIYISIATLPILTLFYFWPAKLLFQNLIIFPFFNYTQIGGVPANLVIYYFIFLLLIFIYLRPAKIKQIFFLLWLQSFLLLSTIPRADSYHLQLAIFPILALLPVVLEKIYSEKKLIRIFYFSIILILFLAISYKSFLYLYVSPSYNASRRDLLEYIKKNCNSSDYIYAGPFLPGLYFEAKKLNPTAYPWLITSHHTKEQFTDAQINIANRMPECAFLNFANVERFGYDIFNPVDQYILKNYKRINQIGNILIFRKISHN